MKVLRLILGDQLNEKHSWYKAPAYAEYVMMEIRQETDYVVHHVQKVAGIFMAMRKFAELLRKKGYTVHYFKINDQENKQTIEGNLKALLKEYRFTRFEYQEPDEYRLDTLLKALKLPLDVTIEAADTEHFLCERYALAEFFKGKKQFVMEPFYRHMRQKYKLLMDADGQPEGGKWNFDAANRNKWKGDPEPQLAPEFDNNTAEVANEIEQAGIRTIGILPERLPWPTDKIEAQQLLTYFIKHHLQFFGKFQDAMSTEQPFLFHSRLSFALNVKLLHPLEVVHAAIEHYKEQPKAVDIEQIEGFVRQIIGWREYMRGIYWAKMPQFATLNYFNHTADLPEFYWTGKTKMKCMEQSILQSLNLAYAHHIQRLMITGNFALLAGVNPDQVDTWYLGVYIDAFEWVEITNTRGMSQFADGGIVGTKPYVASANYINKMSNYCSDCFYNSKQRTGEGACPFNSLYWNFHLRHENKLTRNPRIGMIYRLLERMSDKEKNEIRKHAEKLLANPDEL